MTAEEIKSKIEFTTRPGLYGDTKTVVASIAFSVEQTIRCDGPFQKDDNLMEAMKADMREAIVRNIFDDQTNEMACAVSKFLHSHYPVDHLNSMEDQKRLMKAARYQPHFHSTSGGKNE